MSSTTNKLFSVFLSYSWSNSAERTALRAALKRLRGINLLVDTKEIVPGDPVHGKVADMLERCDCVVALLTREALESSEVRDELSRASDRGKLILPVVEQGVNLSDLPWHLRDTLYVAYNVRDFDRVVSEVVSALKKHISRRKLQTTLSPPKALQPLLRAGCEVVAVEPGDSPLWFVLHMQQTGVDFLVATSWSHEVKATAEYLVARLLPHVNVEDYDWMLISLDSGRAVTGSHTFKTAGVKEGEKLVLVGNHRAPRWAPQMA